MKILFIYPNVKGQLGFHYGLASLSAVLKRAGHETSLINLNEKVGPIPSPEAIGEAVKSARPDLVGFSVVTPQHKVAVQVARALKSALDVPILFGGVHATMVPEEIIAEEAVDFVCVGEGEDALLELVDALESEGDLTRIRNIWSKEGGRVHRNPVRPLPDPATLPMVDHDLFDFPALTEAKGGWVGLLSSRGCPFRCSYCFNHRMVERYRTDLGVPVKALGYVRRIPVDTVIAEVETLLGKGLGIRMFIFDDDLFTHDPEYVKAFCRRYREIADVPLTVNAHVKRFDREVAEALKGAGCRIVKFGVESGSPRIRADVLNRRMSNEEIVSAFGCAHEAGLVTSAFVMVGLPRETPADLEQTFRCLARARPGRLRWSTFFPFPGTRAFEMAEADGAVDHERLKGLDNFFEDSCLDLGAEMNRLVRRVRWTFPWHVNALLPGPVGERYAPLVKRFEEMSDKEFEATAGDVRQIDEAVSSEALEAGEDPYRIRFNDFMAIRRGAGAEPEE
ncbi:MAG: B12-binding domain-containing radical SAM protein [Planctomycetota bacterium]|jgi:radical SAM superfamily enzyme YgiQ (UPF0313 family)